MKEEFKKNIFQNKRYRALIFLGIYILFFSTIIILSNSNKQIVNKESKKNYINFDIKEIEIKNSNIIYNLDKQEFLYNNIIYKDEPKELKKYNLEKYKNINNLFENSILESKNYIDNYETYLIKLEDYEKIINKKEIKSDENIRLIKYNNKIIIDLQKYLGYKIEVRG